MAAVGLTAVVVDDEVETARQELVRYRVNGWLAAWRDWGAKSGRLQLGGEMLEPESPSDSALQDMWCAWKERRCDAMRSLLSSVALLGEELAAIDRAFCVNLLAEGHRLGAVMLPDRVKISFDPDPVLTRA